MKDLKIELNIKSIMLFEHLSGKSFYEMDDSDMFTLIYASVVTNNPDFRISIEAFNDILSNKRVVSGIIDKAKCELEFVQSMSVKNEESNESTDKGDSDEDDLSVSSIASRLIIDYGMDAEYVMFRMELWELIPLYKEIENKIKQDMTDKRFWTYISMLPHIDGKKVSTPEKLFKFPWEIKKKENKEDVQDFVEKNEGKIMNLFKNKDEDGK